MLVSLYAIEDIKTSQGCIAKGTIFKADELNATKYLHTKAAILECDEVKTPWNDLPWKGYEVCILASGPSMSMEIARVVSDWRNKGDNRRVIAINTTYQLAPWADVLYACDKPWWDHYIKDVRETFKGELWTQCADAQRVHGVRRIEGKRDTGLNFRKGIINLGDNSGYQAIGLAYQAGALKINLFGYDMKGTHWHPDHPESLNKANQYHMWLGWFPKFAKDLQSVNVKVTNYTPNSALRVFPLADLREGIL